MARTKDVNVKSRIDKAKQRLGITNQNPFNATHQKPRNTVLNKKHAHSIKNAPQQQKPKFEAIEDERPSNVPQFQANMKLTEQIRQELPHQESLKIDSKQKSTQEIYMEIMQKSKQAKKERQMLKSELEDKIKQLDDKFSKSVRSVMPTRVQFGNDLKRQFSNQLENIQGQMIKAGAAATKEDAVRQGNVKLQELDKHQPKFKPSIVQKGGDDEEQQFIIDPEFEQNEAEGDANIQNEENEIEIDLQVPQLQQFSAALQKIKFILPVPASYEEFSQMLNSVEPQEEILVLDRLIKTNSTMIDKSNAPQIEQLIQYLITKILSNSQISEQRIDSEVRCLRHCCEELPQYAAGQFNGQFLKFTSDFQQFYVQNGYYPAISVQFLILLRTFQICFFMLEDCQLQQNFFLVLQQMVFKSSLKNNIQFIRYLFLLKILLCECIQTDRFDSGLLFGYQRLLNIEKEGDNEIEFQYLISCKLECGAVINQEIRKDVKFLFQIFKMNFESLPPSLGQLLFNEDFDELNLVQEFDEFEVYQQNEFIFYNRSVNFLQEKQYQIKELDPLVMKNFNPHKTNFLDIDKQKQKIEQKKEKRKEKDEFRKQIRDVKKVMLQKQTDQIQRSLKLKKAKTQRMEEWHREK
uniref:Uncharacterized protein n=1 Tax=Trepomonas sp. PC1 TaxID=1076344 RepID=A0A146KG70_9EUKA|eukprot:JAP95702.1 hypothetical protein TPC1_11211 [Trepomonas sp. PC1]